MRALASQPSSALRRGVSSSRRAQPLQAAVPRRSLNSSSSSTRQAVVMASSSRTAAPPVVDYYSKLKGKTVYRSSDGAAVDLPSLWGPDERAVVAFGRSFGELAIQLCRDVKPRLDASGVKLFLVSIGTYERSIEFAEVTGFPREALLADPESVTYQALGLVKGVRQTFFGSETAFSFLGRMRKPGGMSDLKDVMGRWKPWIPPKQDQAFQQGGMFVFEGERCVWSHFDQATGAHADFAEVEAVAASMASSKDCGCPRP